MKKLYALVVVMALCFNVCLAQDSTSLKIDSLEKSFTYQHGTINIGNGIGTILVPKGFKYLDSLQAVKVLVDLWNNPKYANMSLGFLLPEKQGVLDQRGYVFNIQYDPIGYVKDDDASEIDYAELLTDLQKETTEENKDREAQGYPPTALVGWASKPFYDANRKILHWAKEIRFGTDSINTLNYNVRVLGRKGVLILNAIATMEELALVKADVPQVLNIVNFTEGNKYANFNADVDDVAAWTIGGLVAGKVLAKVGFFALALKFWKFIAIGFVAASTYIRKLFVRRREEKEYSKETVDLDNMVDADESKDTKEPVDSNLTEIETTKAPEIPSKDAEEKKN
jgi:uncharacterized membrane-anchored protein